ncbi:hypothetical protein ABZ454_24215 [Streptomyces sp. NPDC005803]|uniref:hypothetical protein n=1 Tax=Streptomyces sp. NPDC005803 TaxID=3154297 RepID=UPI0034048F30
MLQTAPQTPASSLVPGPDPAGKALVRRARTLVTALGLAESELAPDLVHALLRAGFGVQSDMLFGGVEIRSCPQYYGAGSLLVSWAPHEAAYAPLDPRITQVEDIMAGALLDTVRALGFRADRLGVSYSVLVRPGGRDAR